MTHITPVVPDAVPVAAGYTEAMTTGAPQQPLPGPDEGFTPTGDADLAADPESGTGPGGAPMPQAQDTPADERDDSGADGPGPGNPEKDPADWVTGDEPMTGAQASYLETLAREAGEDVPTDLTKAQASKRIDELQQRTGRGAD